MATTSKHDAKAIDQAINRIASAIAQRHAKTSHLLLLAIADGGNVLARRLATRLQTAGLSAGVGIIDISFHRDDISRHPIPKELPPTAIPHDINGATVILVDDVLNTGRSVKAALDELFDHGRPDCVELAVLIDRGGRRLPVSADYSGLTLKAADTQKIIVALDDNLPDADGISVLAANRQS